LRATPSQLSRGKIAARASELRNSQHVAVAVRNCSRRLRKTHSNDFLDTRVNGSHELPRVWCLARAACPALPRWNSNTVSLLVVAMINPPSPHTHAHTHTHTHTHTLTNTDRVSTLSPSPTEHKASSLYASQAQRARGDVTRGVRLTCPPPLLVQHWLAPRHGSAASYPCATNVLFFGLRNPVLPLCAYLHIMHERSVLINE
jgi:hypothetical protein